MKARMTVAVAVLAAALLMACCTQFPEGLHDPCASDADCLEDYVCLPWDGELVCSVPCDTADDCPVVRSSHCGNQTLCEEGVCGFYYCR